MRRRGDPVAVSMPSTCHVITVGQVLTAVPSEIIITPTTLDTSITPECTTVGTTVEYMNDVG